MQLQKLGWHPDVPDARDLLFAPEPAAAAAALPANYALQFPWVFDQGALGSCTANAVLNVWEFTQREMEAADKIMPSRLALYYFSRFDQGTVSQDSGATIRGALKAAAKHGVCREALWPYNVAKYKLRPSLQARNEQAKHIMKDAAYARVAQTEDGIKRAIFGNNPIAFGFGVYEDFVSNAVAKSGIMSMPKPGEKMIGGHAVTAIGWKTDDGGKLWWLVQNSWGEGWGQKGRFWMPGDFLLSRDFCDDLWTVFKVVPLAA